MYTIHTYTYTYLYIFIPIPIHTYTYTHLLPTPMPITYTYTYTYSDTYTCTCTYITYSPITYIPPVSDSHSASPVSGASLQVKELGTKPWGTSDALEIEISRY